MAKKKATDKEDSILELSDRISNVARFAIKSTLKKVGLYNMGSNFWFTDDNGKRILLKKGDRYIISQAVFEREIINRAGYKLGHIIRDDSILVDTDVPAPDIGRPINAITDDEIVELIKKEADALDFIEQCDSEFVLNRVVNICKSKKRINFNIVNACEDKLFMIINELPNNFNELNVKELKELSDRMILPVVFEIGDTAEDIRGKIKEVLLG